MKVTIDNNNGEIKGRENVLKKIEDELTELRVKTASNEAIINELRQQLDLFRKRFDLSVG